jgi:tetratricopeptide (TPR) repeat protein
MKKKMFQEAIDDSYRLLNIDSHNVGAYYIIGCAYEKLDEV